MTFTYASRSLVRASQQLILIGQWENSIFLLLHALHLSTKAPQGRLSLTITLRLARLYALLYRQSNTVLWSELSHNYLNLGQRLLVAYQLQDKETIYYLNQSGEILILLNQLPLAIERFQQSIDRTPYYHKDQHCYARCNIGWATYLTGHQNDNLNIKYEGIRFLRQGLALIEDLPPTHRQLTRRLTQGQIRLATALPIEQRQEALQLCRKVMMLATEHQLVNRYRQARQLTRKLEKEPMLE